MSNRIKHINQPPSNVPPDANVDVLDNHSPEFLKAMDEVMPILRRRFPPQRAIAFLLLLAEVVADREGIESQVMFTQNPEKGKEQA